MHEVPDWLLFDQQDVHDTLVATSKHKPHLIADMAAMANVPGLANGQARRPVVAQTQRYASQVGQATTSTADYHHLCVHQLVASLNLPSSLAYCCPDIAICLPARWSSNNLNC